MSEYIVRLPKIFEKYDYHEFDELEEDFQELLPKIKVREVGFDDDIGLYVGVAYIGAKTSPENMKMFLKAKERVQDNE